MADTVSSSALSFAEFATQSNDPQVREAMFTMIKAGSAFTDLPLETEIVGAQRRSRFIDNLATPDWVPYNTPPTVVKSKATSFEEEWFILRNAIHVDELIAADTRQAGNFVNSQSKAYLKATSYDLNDKFINNNHLSGDADAFVGLRARIDSNSVYGTLSTLKIDASGVDLSNSGQTAATSLTFLMLIQQALDEMGQPEGDGVVMYGNDDLLRRLDKGIKQQNGGGGWDTTRDGFDRHVRTYKNMIVRPIGRKTPSAGGTQSQIITSTETSTGADGSSTMTSAYFCRYGMDALHGWQPWELKPRPAYRDDTGVIDRIVFSWAVGLIMEDPHAIARIYDVKVS